MANKLADALASVLVSSGAFVLGIFGKPGAYCLIPCLVFLLKPYRKKVIQSNFQRCFPNQSPAFYKILHKKFLKYLSEIIIQSLLAFSVSPKRLKKWQSFAPNNLLEQFAHNGTSCLVVMGHTANWEWAGLRAGFQKNMAMAAVYKPLSNKTLNRFLVKKRSRFKTTMVPMSSVPRFLNESNTPFCLTFIADQNPPITTAHWVDFFHQPTAFFSGWARLAVKKNIPVLLASPQDLSPWKRSTNFELLYDGKEALNSQMLCQRFASKLENQIRLKPQAWLWSHKRWKHTFPIPNQP